MPEQFVVPQFIDVEDKVLGPLAIRQFIILLAALLTDTLLFKLFTFGKFLAMSVPLTIVAIAFAFIRINGQPFHYFVLNLVQTFRKPGLRVWDKELSDRDVRLFLKVEEAPVDSPKVRKAPISGSRLSELALVVNTGGVYNPDDKS